MLSFLGKIAVYQVQRLKNDNALQEPDALTCCFLMKNFHAA